MHIQKQQARDFRSCSWRRADSDAQTTCGLMQTITGLPADACRVSDLACIACCDTAVPAIDRLNPTVASLVFSAACDVLEQDGRPGCSVDQARQLQSLAQTHLERVSSHAIDAVIPARMVEPCCYQAEPTSERADGTRQYVCRHPLHETANVHICRQCRDWSHEPVTHPLKLSDILPPPRQRCGPRVQKWAVGVTTAPRRQPTLEACLDSLSRAGWDAPHLFVDGGATVPERFHLLSATWRDRQLGAWSNYVLGLMELSLQYPDADAYLMLQDDAWFFDQENLREYLEHILWPGDTPGIVSLYCSEADTARTDGWHRHPGPWVWGALAFVFPRQVLERFVGDPAQLRRPVQHVNGGYANVDTVTGRWAKSHGTSVWHPTPSLVQHIGNASSIWSNSPNAGPRRADWFAADLETSFHAHATLADFPEDEFPPAAEWKADFDKTVGRGRSCMQQTRVVICGLCRDVRSCLPRTIARIERLGNMFADYRVVLYENDSRDQTRPYLNSWAERNSGVTILTDDFGHERFPQIRSLKRATRLAEYRNQYLEYIRQYYADFDVVIVVDTDLRGGWSYDGIAHTFGQDNWDFTGSYGVLKRCRTRPSRRELLHFDAWAFRDVHCPTERRSSSVNSMTFERGSPMIPVGSCFGGLGVYRMPAFLSARYEGRDCEHVVLHERMKKAGFQQLFLNPAQLLVY